VERAGGGCETEDVDHGARLRVAGGRNAGLAAATAYARDAAAVSDLVVLVEGASDRSALEVLAGRDGRDLGAERISIVPMGGATNLGHFLELLGPRGRGLRLAGLCDAGEEPGFRRDLERAGLGSGLDRAALERRGFFVCTADLEDELIRALGVAGVCAVIEAEGELSSLQRFQRQPAQRGRAPQAQLRRFLGTRSGRKDQYARLLAEALTPARVPDPLARLLAHI
jgi:hypothetical protein